MLNASQNAMPILQVVGQFVIILGITGVLVSVFIEALKHLISEEKITKYMTLEMFALIVNIVFALIVFGYVKVFVPTLLEGYEIYEQVMILIAFLFAVFCSSQLGYKTIVETIKNLLEGKEPNKE